MKKEKTSSASPKASKPDNKLNFLEAMAMIVDGLTVSRKEWNQEKEYCLVQDGYLRIFKEGEFHNWIISDGDITAKDWIICRK